MNATKKGIEFSVKEACRLFELLVVSDFDTNEEKQDCYKLSNELAKTLVSGFLNKKNSSLKIIYKKKRGG